MDTLAIAVGGIALLVGIGIGLIAPRVAARHRLQRHLSAEAWALKEFQQRHAERRVELPR